MHVINACHLDIGFTESMATTINKYFDHHLPMAAHVGAQLRNGSVESFTDNKLGFMFQSWIIDLFLDCPPGLFLHCPGVAAKQLITDAISTGDITWHAFPHNAQLEVMEPALIKAGLLHTFALDAKHGQPRKRTLSQRDVPGVTRGAIPLLRSMGIDTVSVGQNTGSPQPSQHPCFIWRDAASNTSVFGLHVNGYGDVHSGPACAGYGMEHQLVYNFNGDNTGPSTAAQYGDVWKDFAATYPNAQIYASTFDNFTQHLQAVATRLPVLEHEVGDSWIYGVASDPQKVSRMRVINRIYAQVDSQTPGGIGAALASDPVLRNATRFALKGGEHTWGRDTYHTLLDDANWTNARFERARHAAEPSLSGQYGALEASWWEQRHWALTTFVETLQRASHPLAGMVTKGFADLRPRVPSTDGFRLGAASEAYTCGATTIGFSATGAIERLTSGGVTWADKEHALLQLKYRSYSPADVTAFLKSYTTWPWMHWVAHAYGKPGLPNSVLGKVWLPSLAKLYVRGNGTDSCSFLLETAFDPAASAEYGAAAAGWMRVDVAADMVNASIGMFNKTATRLPESMFVQVRPALRTVASGWAANKLGAWIASNDVVRNGTKHLHGVMEAGLRVTAEDGAQLSVRALDAPILSFGEPTAYPSEPY